MGSQQKCKLCLDAVSKYKCPTCLLPYCSLPCYKKHKETPCAKLEPPTDDTEAPSNNEDTKDNHAEPVRMFEVDDEKGWRLKKEQFKSIAASHEIRSMLKDPDLQKLIKKIDSSSEVEKDLNAAMEGELFREFADKVMKTLNKEE